MASMEAVISSSTNWIVAEGSLSDSISFETSDDDAAAAETKRLLLRRPPPPSEEEDPPPCEITIIFRRKHELHRVYLRSTARIYEMYYASDHRSTDIEYLCTVRCGEAVNEVASSVVTKEADECQGNDKGTPEQVARSDSTTSDEDGWIQVKVPDSPQENKNNPLSKSGDSPNMQTHYEATAEISDSSPCVSLTLRLLSVETKDCVHVEEIYIYADPVDSTSLDPPTTMSETSGGSSLLAMLVPTLLGLSKSRSCGMQEKGSSEEPRGTNYQRDTQPARTISMDMGKSSAVNSGEKHLDPSEKVQELNQAPNSCTDQHTNMCYNRLEKSLDELLSRVGRIEAFCSRFEENMMKPLSCMDVRLQEVEHKLDSLVASHQSSEQLLPVPEFLFEESLVASHQSSEQLLPVPKFLFEESDSVNKFCNTECRRTEKDIIADTVLPVDDIASSPPELGTRPGLVVKAPEFPNEDDECVDTDDNLYEESVSVNNLCNTEGREAREDTIADAMLPVDAMASSSPSPPSHEIETSTSLVVKDKVMSIDDVIASTLKAFLTSNTVRSPNTSSTVVTNGTSDSIKSVVSEGDDCISVEKEKGVRSGDSSLVLGDAGLGRSRGVHHNFWARANDDDCEKVVPISGFVSQWNDEYSSSSSLDEHFVGNKIGIGRSGGGSIDSSRGYSTHFLISNDTDGENTDSGRGNLTPFVVPDDSDSGRESTDSSPDDYFIKDEVDILNSDDTFGNVSPVSSFENKSINHYDFSTAKPNAGLVRELSSSTLDSEDIYNVSFAPEKDWVSGLPLEVLLGESPDADGVTSENQQHIPSSSRGTDGNADADGGLLLNLEDSALLTDDELKAFNNIPLYIGLF